jgi:hypothetical protein
MDHIIRRQLLELTLDGSQPPFNLQNRLGEEYYHTLLPILEEWFDRLAGEEEVLHIDTLILDLGLFSSKDFNDEELRRRLTKKLHSPDTTITLHTTNGQNPPARRRSTRHNACEQWLWYMEKGYLPWNLLRPDKEWEKKVLETLATDYAAISRLRTMLADQPVVLARIARQQDEIFLTRLVEILTTVTQTTLSQTLQELRQLLAYSSRLETSKIDHVPSSEKTWQDTLSLAATLIKEGTTLELGRRILTAYWAGHQTFVPVLEDYLAAHVVAKELISGDPAHIGHPAQPTTIPADPSGLPSPGEILPHTALQPESRLPLHNEPSKEKTSDQPHSFNKPTNTKDQAQLNPPDQQTSPSESPKKPNAATRPSIPPTDAVTPANQPISPSPKRLPETPPASPDGAKPISKPTIKRDDPATSAKAQTDTNTQPGTAVTPAPPEFFAIDQLPEEGIFLLNAGVILTHPFLNHLFKQSGLIVNGKFIAGEARQKAIHLIHYLATGRTIAEEFELAAAKILCGCPLEEPMEKTFIYTEEELKEADSLLEGCIAHWGVKGVTTEGLRGNFLTRSGKLSPKSDKLQLVIEKHAVDILIRTYPFPWNMSIIKLPWFKQAIHLDW